MGVNMDSAGLIINPDSGKDVRRIASYATYVGNFTKAELGKRVVMGMCAAGVEKIYIMHDSRGLGEEVLSTLEGRVESTLELIETHHTADMRETMEAASAMERKGVKSIVIVGGDGTLRAAFLGARNTPLATVSAGTNNVTGNYLDACLVGYAAGIVATSTQPSRFANRVKSLKVYVNGTYRSEAIVDVAVLKTPVIGARAIVEVEDVSYIILSKGEPTDIGLASILGYFSPTSFTDLRGYYLKLAHPREAKVTVKAPILPGVFKEVGIADFKELRIGDKVNIPKGKYAIALDGEREIEVSDDDEVTVEVSREGPLLINIPEALRSRVRSP
jgi:predicted polyphosphate/ATP-dependent NAD kinase